MSDCISMTSTIEASSTTSRSQSSGLSSPRLKSPPLGSTSSSRWIVLASKPVASVMRLAARPVGAHSRSLTPFAARMRRIPLTMVVLPTPGPPVMTNALDINASRIAATWLSARVSPIRSSTQGSALSGLIQGQGSVPFATRISRSAIERSARCRPARNTQDVSPTLSAMTVPSVRSRSSAMRTSSAGTSSSFSASGTSSSVGKPQCPSSIASVSA